MRSVRFCLDGEGNALCRKVGQRVRGYEKRGERQKNVESKGKVVWYYAKSVIMRSSTMLDPIDQNIAIGQEDREHRNIEQCGKQYSKDRSPLYLRDIAK